MRALRAGAAILAAWLASAATGVAAAPCGPAAGPFDRWLEGVKREAAEEGVSPRALAALDGVRFQQSIVSRDRGQGVFSQSFLTFSDRMVSRDRLQRGLALMKTHAATLARIEQQFGVPGPVLVAFWGLETDFGAVQGNYPVLPALATLAYDCRRPDEFRAQLIDALRIIDRGDLTPAGMVGAWAGELGQMQFLPSNYVKYGVDFDRDGRRDLLRSVPDVLASTANYIASLGWQRGQPWLQEVRVPAELPWDQADLAIRHPRQQWSRWGVTLANGAALPADSTPASLLLPMGRRGPAFLAYPNFAIYTEWNNSLIYATSAAYFATRLAGAPPLARGGAAGPGLSAAEVKELQTLLVRQGHPVGKVDGILGAASRAGVKAMQIKFGLPADSYPTPELLQRMRGR